MLERQNLNPDQNPVLNPKPETQNCSLGFAVHATEGCKFVKKETYYRDSFRKFIYSFCKSVKGDLI